MNADKMTRQEFDQLWVRVGDRGADMWDRIEAIQSAPFVPDWSLKPDWATGFLGTWTDSDQELRHPGEFYMPAPSNPSDAELSAMWEKLDRDKRVQILRDAGVVV